MKILLFSDVHYFGGDVRTAAFNTDQKLVAQAMPMLERLIQIANEEYHPDLCVNLGDLIQDDRDKQRDLETFAMVYGKLSALCSPCHTVLGNHDLKMMDSIEDLKPVLGCVDSYSVDAYGCHLIFLQPQLRPELGTRRGGSYKAQYISEETIHWLQKDLLENALPVLIFLHFPLSEDETVEDTCAFLENRAEVKRVLKEDKNLLAVFAGHRHVSGCFEEEGVRYFLAGSLLPGAEHPWGEYLEIELQGRHLEVRRKNIPISE